MTGEPLVSCVMPTRNRRVFAAQAIWYFLRQDYRSRELIVVDDGDERVEDLVPEDDRIRYVRLAPGLSLGAKRNVGNELARGEIVAHWDDDDWIAPDRLRRQVEAVLASGAAACAARVLLHYRLENGDAWLYRGIRGRPEVAGCTLVYRRGAWEAHPFPELAVGEDTEFVRNLPADAVHTLDDPPYYVALIHKGNTGTKHLADARWEPQALDEVAQRLGPDGEFYVGLRDGRHTSTRRARPRETTTVTVAAPFLVYDGYGSMAEYLVRGMAREGAQVDVEPLDLDLDGLSGEFRRILAASRPHPSAPLLYFCWPRPDLDRFRARADLFVNTMWESSRLPEAWPARLNRARAVIVPSGFVERVCRDSGVEVPIAVVPEGIDPAVYRFEERPPREGLTTLIVGTYVRRKNTAIAIEAWKAAFAGDRAARLVVKSRFGYGNFVADDERIQLVDANETTRGIAHWYREADVLLALGSEGFGLPLIEGMATGLPVIALASEGQADTCAAAGELVLAVAPRRFEPYDEPTFGRCGVHGVPAVGEVAERLRWVDGHRDEARALGRAAAVWAPREFDVWAKAPAVLDVLERSVRPPRPLRRRWTLWVPTAGTPCGLAEYAAGLAEELPELVVTGGRPDPRGLRVLHVQHEPSVFDDVSLGAAVQEARTVGVPVVVTEHAVTGQGRSWERDADVLLATTTAGAGRLRARWPGKWVEHLPLPCPSWFPPRKRGAGRVLGAFGFLERHKGFWQLLEALREIEGAELLLFSHAKHAALESEFEEAARGLRVRWTREFLPSEEIARRLAAEADVLVFWYDEAPFAAASAAARLGLASGVPVLTSPTSWFADLAAATFQPHDLVEGVRRLLDDAPLRNRLTAAARELCEEQSRRRIAERHKALWRTIERI